jgi:hypothetical protein
VTGAGFHPQHQQKQNKKTQTYDILYYQILKMFQKNYKSPSKVVLEQERSIVFSTSSKTEATQQRRGPVTTSDVL